MKFSAGVLSPTKPQRSEGLQRSECMQGAGFTQMSELTTSPTENSLDVKETTKASTPSSDSGIVEPHSLVEPRGECCWLHLMNDYGFFW